jgi:hypothetical protein
VRHQAVITVTHRNTPNTDENPAIAHIQPIITRPGINKSTTSSQSGGSDHIVARAGGHPAVLTNNQGSVGDINPDMPAAQIQISILVLKSKQTD